MCALAVPPVLGVILGLVPRIHRAAATKRGGGGQVMLPGESPSHAEPWVLGRPCEHGCAMIPRMTVKGDVGSDTGVA